MTPQPQPPDQCQICALNGGEYLQRGLTAHLVEGHGVLTAEDEIRHVIDRRVLTGDASFAVAARNALMAVLERCDAYRSSGHYHETLVSTALIADIRARIAAALTVDARPADRQLPRGHLTTTLAGQPGEKVMYVCRSTTGWVAWAGPVKGRPKDGVLTQLPVDDDQPAAHIAARRMAEWWLERNGWNLDGLWADLRLNAAGAPIAPVPDDSNPTHPNHTTEAHR